MKLMVIDGNSILNRAFYAIRPLTAKDGTNTNAILGFMNILYKFQNEEQPDRIAICFDVSRKTFRNEQFDGYKATRKGMPDELREQLPLVKEILSALGYVVLGVEGYEADDLLGTLSNVCTQQQLPCVLVTGDRDSLQLVNDFVTVKLPTTRMGKTETTVYDMQKIQEVYQVTPDKMIDIKALMGDASDNIPGVAGIGEKTAIELISTYGSIEYLYEHLEEIPLRPAVCSKLAAGKDMAFLSKKLATICLNAPIDLDLDNYRVGPIKMEQAYTILKRLDMYSTMDKFGVTKPEIAVPKESDVQKKQYRSFSRNKGLQEILEKAKAQGRLYYIIEDSRMYVCFSDEICICDQFGQIYLTELDKYTYDCKTQHLSAIGKGEQLQNVVFDLKLAAYLLDPMAKDYSIMGLCDRYGISPTQYPCVDAPAFGDDIAAIEQACVFMALCEKLEHELIRTDMQKLMREIELPLSEVLSAMEFYGFGFDYNGISSFGDLLQERLCCMTQQIYAQAGEEFNINSPKQLGVILFDKLMLPSRKKTKTGYSTNVDVLESLKGKHPIIELILEYRQLQKLKSTYVDGLLKQVGQDGRIHTTFIQTETRTGRLSSIEPNLQNIPVRTPLGSKLREFFIAKEGYTLVDADYSQIELRVLAHIADDANMKQAFIDGADIHTSTAAKVFGVPPDQVTPQMRSRAKAVNFGIVYGIGAYSLSQDIGTSIGEADRMIKEYLRNFSGVKAYMEQTVADASVNGYVTTLLGRRRMIPEILASNKVLKAFGERVAMNTPIQGTAADIIKIAMIRVYHRLKRENVDAKLILQVHDELIAECKECDAIRVALIIKEEMEQAVELTVPMSVDVHIGRNWYAAKG